MFFNPQQQQSSFFGGGGGMHPQPPPGLMGPQGGMNPLASILGNQGGATSAQGQMNQPNGMDGQPPGGGMDIQKLLQIMQMLKQKQQDQQSLGGNLAGGNNMPASPGGGGGLSAMMSGGLGGAAAGAAGIPNALNGFGQGNPLALILQKLFGGGGAGGQ